MYQTHPRTKGSTGYPDQIAQTDHFRDPAYLGSGWKAMPADLSSPRLGERSLNLLDDLSSQGFRKKIFGEVDVLQFDATYELYAQMNINYLRLDELPSFDRWGDAVAPLARGDFFTTTGEVLLENLDYVQSSDDGIKVRVSAAWTFPLRFAEVVWGEGGRVHRERFGLADTRPHSYREMGFELDAPEWE